MQSVWFLFSGRRHSGKDTAADMLHARIGGTRASFAARVKRECAESYNLDYDRLMNDIPYKELHRNILIHRGNLRRSVDTNYWVDGTFADHRDALTVIVSDWRFPNEAQRLRDLGVRVITVRITRANRDIAYDPIIDGDVSETSLDNAEFDIVIENGGTLEELAEKVGMIF